MPTTLTRHADIEFLAIHHSAVTALVSELGSNVAENITIGAVTGGRFDVLVNIDELYASFATQSAVENLFDKFEGLSHGSFMEVRGEGQVVFRGGSEDQRVRMRESYYLNEAIAALKKIGHPMVGQLQSEWSKLTSKEGQRHHIDAPVVG